MRKYLKWAAIVLAAIALLLFLTVKILSEDPPEGKSGPAADRLAHRMLNALNKPAWDSLKYLSWNFADRHQYLYDKPRNRARISWDETVVDLNLDRVTGRVTVGGKELSGAAADEYVQKAWSYWCNDSFWMLAPFKVFDPGTERSIVTDEDGSRNLLITYAGGGVTPGDAYLWLLGPDYVPTAFKMWVSIIPIGGMKASWEEWVTLSGGARVSTFHDLGILKSPMKGVREGEHFSDFGLVEDPFLGL